MIFSCFPCIGKSTLAQDEYEYIDLDSSAFYVDGRRPEGWYEMYVKQALALSKQGYNVLISSEPEVREYMRDHNYIFIAVTPGRELKDEWLERYKEKYLSDPSIENHERLSRALDHFDEDTEDLRSENLVITLTCADYTLKERIKRYVERNFPDFS